MKRSRLNYAVFLSVTVTVLLVCLIIICIFSGFEHETKKFKTMLVTIVLILIFHFLICDPIKFAVLAIDSATWPKVQHHQVVEDSTTFSHIDFLKLRLKSLKSQLLITKDHRNEQLNEKYHLIANDLFLYGSYFLVLLLYVLVHQDVILHYNTKHIKDLFEDNQTDTLGVNEIMYLDHIYDFIELSLINPFEPDVAKNHHNSWSLIEATKMLGVVRLRQVRVVDTHIGLSPPEFETKTFLPEWQLPYQRLHYTDKYWRIYEPWQPLIHNPTMFNGLILNFNHIGFFQLYPELNGYIALLTANKPDSMKVLEYLRAYNWLDHNTSAVFMDFTLYNADANIFTVCNVRVENTAFGFQIPSIRLDSAFLLANLDQQTHLELIILFFYFLLLIQFARVFVVKIWFDPKEIKKGWNLLDLVILMLNVFILILNIMREAEIAKLLEVVEMATKSEFLEFRRPIRLFFFTSIVTGFLICLTTLRLWKVFQFASVFQTFTKTLYMAWSAVLNTGITILIFIMAFGIAVSIINGDNSANFYHITKSTVSCMCFAMGFTSHMSDPDMFFGGQIVGVILYLILVFIVVIVLINVFASIIYAHFGDVEQRSKEKRKRQINFLQFLRVEYSRLLKCCQKCIWIRKEYHRHGRTVSENIKQTLDERERFEARTAQIVVNEEVDEYKLNMDYIRRLERSYCLVAIMRVQLELLERMTFGDKNGNLEPLSDSDYTSDSDIPEMYRKEKKVTFNV